MTLSEMARYRLAAQQLSHTGMKTAPELAAYLGAVQGQKYGPPKWGLGLRLPHLSDAAIEADFTCGKILRTHLLLPTWHFVAADDIRSLIALTGARVNAVNNFMYSNGTKQNTT